MASLRLGALAFLLGGLSAARALSGCGLSDTGTAATGLDGGPLANDSSLDTRQAEGSVHEGATGDGPGADAGPDAPRDLSDGRSPVDARPPRDAGACPTGQGPTMIQVPGADGGPPFCIDSTEVTDTQYLAFLAAGDAGAQPSFCGFNTSNVPSMGMPSSDAYPVANVDWCDAYAYCGWAGKRLCGEIGGGPVSYDNSQTDPTKDQWYAACSQDGMWQYPYGSDTMQPGSCNVPPTAGPAPVKNFFACVGGYPGIFDMVGNVQEWEDSCATTTGNGDECQFRGGSFLDGNNGSCLSTQLVATRDFTASDIGFRCCWP